MRRSVLPLTLIVLAAASLVGLRPSAALRAQGAPVRKKLLFLTHPGVVPGHDSLPAAERMAVEYGKTGGFDVTVREGYKTAGHHDLSFLTMEYLNSFDGLMLMTNGDLPWTDVQRKGIVEFVRGGKGLVGVHCATLTMYEYPEFGEMLGGYYVRSVTPGPDMAAGRISTLKVEDTTHPATRMLGSGWPIDEEFYNFAWLPWSEDDPTFNVTSPGNFHPPMGFSRDRVHVLLSLDTAHGNLKGLRRVYPGGDYPQSWWRNYGQGRSFYTALGHRTETWTQNEVFRHHLTGGIRWALHLED